MVNVLVVTGAGIGCHEEVKFAYEMVGAKADYILIDELLKGKDLSNYQIVNFSGGFLHGDILGSGMVAASRMNNGPLKDQLIRFSEENVIYGQCNGFQLLVKSGLLPGIDDDYSKQVVTLTHNDSGLYQNSFTEHYVIEGHFAFEGVDEIDLWCRHGEGKLMFRGEHGSVSRSEAEKVRQDVLDKHVLLYYDEKQNPNGSEDDIAGLVNSNGNIFGHMAHPEVNVFRSRNPNFGNEVVYGHDPRYDAALKIFENIYNRFDKL